MLKLQSLLLLPTMGLALAAGPALAANDPPTAELVAGTRLKAGPQPLPELTPFQPPIHTAAVQAESAPAAQAAAEGQPALSTAELLLAGVAVLAFVALRYRN